MLARYCRLRSNESWNGENGQSRMVCTCLCAMELLLTSAMQLDNVMAEYITVLLGASFLSAFHGRELTSASAANGSTQGMSPPLLFSVGPSDVSVQNGCKRKWMTVSDGRWSSSQS